MQLGRASHKRENKKEFTTEHHLSWDFSSLRSKHSTFLCCIYNSGSSNIWANIAVTIFAKNKVEGLGNKYELRPAPLALKFRTLVQILAHSISYLLLPEEKRWLR